MLPDTPQFLFIKLKSTEFTIESLFTSDTVSLVFHLGLMIDQSSELIIVSLFKFPAGRVGNVIVVFEETLTLVFSCER